MEQKLKFAFLAVYFVAIIVEVVWSVRKEKNVYNWRDSLANFAIVLIGKLIKPLSLIWSFYLFNWVMPYQIFTLPVTWLTVIAGFLLTELVYYWYHRISHETPILWAVHNAHHSSEWFNFSTAGRLNWLGKFTSPVFYLPLILLGFDPGIIVGSMAVSLIYQIFIHTQMIGKLGFLEGVLFNTPSAHRVHHAKNETYIDKNYGGTLIIYDRIFGTYTPEKESVVYGVTTGFIGHNPFRINFYPFVAYFKKLTGNNEKK